MNVLFFYPKTTHRKRTKPIVIVYHNIYLQNCLLFTTFAKCCHSSNDYGYRLTYNYIVAFGYSNIYVLKGKRLGVYVDNTTEKNKLKWE